MENVLVAGATGLTGKHIINLLKDSDRYTPIALVRKKEDKEQFEKDGVDARLGDLSGDLKGVMADMDKAIFAAGSGSSTPESATIEIDQKGAIQLIKQAESYNTSKFVMLSAMNADHPEKWGDMQTYYKAKHEADEVLRSAKLKYSIVRPGALTKDGGTGKVKIAENIEESGKISREDVAKVLVKCLDDACATQKSFDLLSGDTEIDDAIDQV